MTPASARTLSHWSYVCVKPPIARSDTRTVGRPLEAHTCASAQLHAHQYGIIELISLTALAYIKNTQRSVTVHSLL